MATVLIHFYLQHLKLYCLFLGNACISALLRNPFDWIGHKNRDLALFLKGVKRHAPRRS